MDLEVPFYIAYSLEYTCAIRSAGGSSGGGSSGDGDGDSSRILTPGAKFLGLGVFLAQARCA